MKSGVKTMVKSLLNIGNTVVDITSSLTFVSALDKETGKLMYRGNGLVVFRNLHVDGNALIFLNYSGQQRIFGEWVNIYYIPDNWKSWDYAKYTMVADDDAELFIGGVDKQLRDLSVI